MIFSVFIPINNDENSHGKGCICPKCLEKERLKNLPKEYFECCYAIPKNIYNKNQIFKIFRTFFIILGSLLMLSPFILINYRLYDFLFLFSIMTVGAILIVITYIIFDKFIKNPYQIEDKIYLERKGSEDFKSMIKDHTKYKFTKIEIKY